MNVVNTTVVSTIAEFRKKRGESRQPFALVPTMGSLHAGHLELVRCAKAESAHVAVSIFVNPTQFSGSEDFGNYPRDPEHDSALLREAGVDVIFTPSVEEIYPPGFQTFIEVTRVSMGLEGERRPGHFRGVATVVNKLFNIAQPDRAYFGQKDAQQVAVIRRMVADLAMPIEIITVPTVRDTDGLALSSRNVYLSAEERRVAPILFRALSLAKADYSVGERDPMRLRQRVAETIATEPTVAVDYISLANLGDLHEQQTASDAPLLLSLAARLGRTRLLDNVLLGTDL